MQKEFNNKSIKDYILNWRTIFALGLIVTSVLIYYIHYSIFKDLHHILVFLVEDVAFIPIEVLIVTLIIHRLLEVRDEQKMIKKLNMVIGAFYSEVGNDLMSHFVALDPESKSLKEVLKVNDSWTEEDFKKIDKKLKQHQYSIDADREALINLREFLAKKRKFLLSLLENPNLLEHERFTDLLWAVFHLTEEFIYREDFKNITDEDKEHVEGDIERAYIKVVSEWLLYMQHLKEDYPYLFSLAVRTNPFDENAKVEIT